MWPFRTKSRGRVAVVLHDGATWHVRVLAGGKSGWEPVAQMRLEGQNPRNVPDALLDFADNQGARRVRMLLPQSVQALQMEIPADIDPEELQMAMAYELGGETGAEVEGVRIAAARAELFRMGGATGTLLVAAFDEGHIAAYEAACRNEGLLFDGVGCLELAVLAVHASRRPDARLLLLRRDAGFYATPGTETMPMSVGGVALGVREDPREHDEERRERIIKRFQMHQTVPLCVWCAPMPDDLRTLQLRTLVGGIADVEFLGFEAAVEDVARQAAETVEIGSPGGGGTLVGSQPPEVDPHRAGTWILSLILAATLLGLGVWWQHLRSNLTILTKKIAALDTIQQEKKSLEGKRDGLKAEQDRCQETVKLLGVRNPLPPNLIPLLDALNRSVPEFTRITTIEPDREGWMVVRGHTGVQDRLNELYKGLLADMGKLGGRVEVGEVSPREGTNEYEFSFRVGPLPDRPVKPERPEKKR